MALNHKGSEKTFGCFRLPIQACLVIFFSSSPSLSANVLRLFLSIKDGIGITRIFLARSFIKKRDNKTS